MAYFQLINAAENNRIEAQWMVTLAPKHQAEQLELKSDLQERMYQRLLSQPVKSILQVEYTHIKYFIINSLLCADSSQKQIKKGVKLLTQLAEEKCTNALNRLGSIYIMANMKGIPKDIPRGYQYWQQGATLNDAHCLCSLAYFWQQGMGGKVDLQKSLDYFRQAAVKGGAHANNLLGLYHCHDNPDMKMDLKQAASYFQRAIELDQPKNRRKKSEELICECNTFKHATKNLAKLYYTGGPDFPSDEAKAIDLLKLSIADGLGEAAILLSGIYLKKRKVVEYSYYLDIAAKMGEEPARKMIAAMPSDIKQLFEANLAKKKPKTKEQMLAELKMISQSLPEQLEWKITDNKQAWAYVSGDLLNILMKMGLHDKIKKSTNGRHLILINDIYGYDLDDIAYIFEQIQSNTAAPADSKSEPVNRSALATNAIFADNNATVNAAANSPAVPPASKCNVMR